MTDQDRERLRAYLRKGAGFVPQLSVDCVIFTYHEQQLKVLLVQPMGLGTWALPGGFVAQQQDVEAAAAETLRERTGLREVPLHLFGVFGKADRQTQDAQRAFFLAQGMEAHEFEWLMKRYVSIGYYALVQHVTEAADGSLLADEVMWQDVYSLPPLAFDHADMVNQALETLRTHIDQQVAQSRLLPEPFTMNALQTLYETILNRPLRRNNFQRRMLGLGTLERMEKLFTGGAHKAPFLYRFL